MIRLVGGPISGERTAPMPTLVHPFSASSHGTPVSSASGLATMLISLPARHCWRRTFPLTVRSSIPTSGRATGGRHASHATVRHGVHEWARDDDGDGRREVHGNTCEGRAQRSEPIGIVFGAFISDTCIFTWRRMKPSSMRNASHPI
jgi:hypothetical protein